MKYVLLLSLMIHSVSFSIAQEVVSEVIGFNKVTCLRNSDTIVAVPFRQVGSLVTKLSTVPSITADQVVLSVNATLVAGQFNKHYVKVIDGFAKDGSWFNVMSNTQNTITISLNGDTFSGVTTGAAVLIAEYWTLDTLYPASSATTNWTETPVGSSNWVENGHAIVGSVSSFLTGRRSELLLPNILGVGVNLSSSGTYYIFNGGWRKQGQSTLSNFGGEIIYPDQFFTIRHPFAVTYNTSFRSYGEVDLKSFCIPLNTSTVGGQDNYIGLIRGVDVTLNQLTLGGTSAFVSSTSSFLSGRRDEVLVFNSTIALQNRSASAVYYYFNNSWRKQGQPATQNFGSDIIPAGSGFIVRKFRNTTGETSFWKNLPSYL